jgi:hypothetical protein
LPDAPAPSLFQDWRVGRDAALEAAMAHVTNAEANEIDRARVFYYERESQRVGWRPFWRA